MVPAGFRDKIAEFIRKNALPVDKYGHQPRLYALTREVGRGLQYDDDVVYAAAWLHDLGVFVGHRPEEHEALKRWDHVQYATERVPGILAEAGFPAEKIPAVLDVIRTHQPHDDPTSIEGVILRDADILEQLGAIGVFRAIAKVGRDTRFFTFTEVAVALHKTLDNLPGKIRLDSTKKLAEPKILALKMFLKASDREAVPELF